MSEIVVAVIGLLIAAMLGALVAFMVTDTT
jgi:hypothetical protein